MGRKKVGGDGEGGMKDIQPLGTPNQCEGSTKSQGAPRRN